MTSGTGSKDRDGRCRTWGLPRRLRHQVGRTVRVAALAAAVFAAAAAALQEARANERVFVGASTNNFPSVNVLDKNGEPTGFDRELAQAVVAAAGGTVTHMYSPIWTEVLKWLDSGEADFVHDTGFTEDRLAYLDYSDPILEMPERIFVRSERFDIARFEDLNGRTIACINQHTSHLFLVKFPEIECEIVKRPVDGILAVLNGDVDAFVYPRQIALYYAYNMRLRGEIKAVGPPVRTLTWNMAVKKGNRDVMAMLNEGIAKVKASGELKKIYDKWFGESMFHGHSTDAIAVVAGGAIVMTALAAVIAFILFYALKTRSARDRLAETLEISRRFEEALRDSEERFRVIAETTPVAMIVARMSDARIVYSNHHAAHVLGLHDTALFGRTLTDFYVEPSRHERLLEAAANQRVVRDIELELCAVDGTVVSILVAIRKILYDGEESIVFGFNDISERKRTEEALRQSEARYAGIVEDQTDLISRIAGDGTRTFVNSSFCRLLGKTEAELLGTPVYEIVHPDDVPQLRKYLAAFTPESSRSETENRVRRHDGEYRCIHWVYRAVFDPKGRVREYQAVGRDITERKRLESISERLTAAIDALSEGVALYDAEDRLVFANKKLIENNAPMAEHIRPGLGFEDFVRMLAANGLVPEAAGREEEWLAERVARHRNPEGPFEQPRLGGKHLLISEKRLPDGGTMSLATDISERKRTEEALRDSEARYAAIVEDQTEFIGRSTADGTRIFVNGAYCRFLGKTEDQLIGSQVRDVLHPDHVELLEECLASLTPGSPRAEADNRVRRHDGEYRWVHWAVRGVFDDDGDLVEFQSVGRDITERRRAEEAAQRLGRLVESSLNEVYVFDAETLLFTDVNAGARRNLGYGMDELRVLTPLDLKPEYTRQSFEALLRPLRDGEQQIVTFETVHRRKDGSEYPIEVHLQLSSTESPPVFIANILDVTEQKGAAALREELEAQLRQAQKLETLGTLTNGIAHDFNNILAPILGFVEMALCDLPEGTQTHRTLNQVLRAALRAKDLVRQILTFGGKLEQEFRPLDVAVIVAEALGLLRPSLPSTIEIDVDISPDLPRIMGNPTQIHQVVMNLCTNAYQAMRDEGGILGVGIDTVEPGSEKLPISLGAGTYVELTISDSGRGMDAETMERVFEPFYTTREVGDGTGLGLSVAHGIIGGHNGTITVQSAPGRGTAVRVYLPVTEANTREEPVTAADSASTFEGNHVLYVDDEVEITEMSRQMLERLGFRVTVSTDSRKALETFRAEPDAFDIVITDYTMPKLTGLKLSEEIHRIYPAMPIILMTGAKETISRADRISPAIRVVLNKPVEMDEFSGAIGVALNPTRAVGS